MIVQNLSHQQPFTTKDGSTIRSILDRTNAPVQNQSLAEAQVPAVAQAAAAVAEFGGGIGLVLGLLTPLWALLLVGTMGVAIQMAHLSQGHAFVATAPGEPSFELAAVYFAINVMFLLVGPGRLSVDALLFGRKSTSPPVAR